MQHEVFLNRGIRTRASQPFLTVLQADFADGPAKLACFLFSQQGLRASKTVIPVIFDGTGYFLAIEAMFSVRTRLLGPPIGSIASYRDDITRALDWLFTGI